MLLYYQFNAEVLLLITVQCTFNRPEQRMIILATVDSDLCSQ